MEALGRLQHTPIPRKLKIRATAVRAMLRAAGDGSLWVATDTGMILKLVE